MPTSAQIKQQMQQTLALLEEDLRTLRPGRASGDLVASLPVAAYGGTQPLNQIASISANEQGQLIIAPWDKAVVGAAEAAIRDSQLGFSVINEGAQLRLSLPPLSQERRLEFVKLAHQKGEAARIRLRTIRREAIDELKYAERSGGVHGDMIKVIKDHDQMIDEFNSQVKTVVEAKEKELLAT